MHHFHHQVCNFTIQNPFSPKTHLFFPQQQKHYLYTNNNNNNSIINIRNNYHFITCCHSSIRKSPPSISDLKRLTSRVVELTRRRQLEQVFEEIAIAKKRYGSLNTIVMNAVLEACVHCGDIESALKLFKGMSHRKSCGVDTVSYGIILKGLGRARRFDEAFQLLESVERGCAAGTPKLSAFLLHGLLNTLIDAGNLRRVNGLLARYSYVFREGGSPSIFIYNLLIKGYVTKGSLDNAFSVHDNMLRQGLQPDKFTYNMLILGAVNAQKLDVAVRILEEMKVASVKNDNDDLLPDSVTYTTLLKGSRLAKDTHLVQKILLEIKTAPDLSVDRIAYTALVDALLSCGSINGALCVFGEILKVSAQNANLRPKPHLYISLMRAMAHTGDFLMVKNLHRRMWFDTTGKISTGVQEEADHLLMEAAVNSGQVELAVKILSDINAKWKGISWTSVAGLAAVRLEALLGLTRSMFHPHTLPQVSIDDPMENIMTPFEEARPLPASLKLKEVTLPFVNESVVPVIDDRGNCVGLLYHEDCTELDLPISAMMRSPPPYVTASTSTGRVIDLILQKHHKMVIVVKYRDTCSSFGLRPVGVFTHEQLNKLMMPPASTVLEQNLSEPVKPP